MINDNLSETVPVSKVNLFDFIANPYAKLIRVLMSYRLYNVKVNSKDKTGIINAGWEFWIKWQQTIRKVWRNQKGYQNLLTEKRQLPKKKGQTTIYKIKDQVTLYNDSTYTKKIIS